MPLSKRHAWLWLSLWLWTCCAPAVLSAAPEVVVAQGKMFGMEMQSREGRPIYAFRGIPYAAPPLGNLRFQAPKEPEPWKGLLNATADATECLQKNYLVASYPLSGSEDCLYLNVFTPSLTPQNGPLPVMVYIHGGGYFSGSNSIYFLGPEFLLDKDVVLVTIQYRLGALGFLSTGDEYAPGNAGMKDQVAALRWVRRNIAAFGGNPDRVTLFGQSAGSGSVHFHMLSKMSAGLFQQAIAQSGWALDPWALSVDPWPSAQRQGSFVNCSSESSASLVLCLQQVDARLLTDSGHKFHHWSIDPLTVFRPIVEKGPDAFLDEDPRSIIMHGRFTPVPWMTGVVRNEGAIRSVAILADSALLDDLNSRFNTLMPTLLKLEANVAPEAVPDTWKKISQFYFNTQNGYLNESTYQAFTDMYSDRSFLHGFTKSVMQHAKSGHKNHYIYEFNYRGDYSYSMTFGGTPKDYGACHCDDLIYLFHSPALFPKMLTTDGPDSQVLKQIVTLWTNFATYGNPTPHHLKGTQCTNAGHEGKNGKASVPDHSCSTFENLVWEPYAPEGDKYDIKYLEISKSDASGSGSDVLKYCMREGFKKERMDFLNSLQF